MAIVLQYLIIFGLFVTLFVNFSLCTYTFRFWTDFGDDYTTSCLAFPSSGFTSVETSCSVSFDYPYTNGYFYFDNYKSTECAGYVGQIVFTNSYLKSIPLQVEVTNSGIYVDYSNSTGTSYPGSVNCPYISYNGTYTFSCGDFGVYVNSYCN